MSFIYKDDNLINDLLNIGVHQSNKLLKYAQVIDPNAMQAMLDRLGNDLTGAAPSGEVPKSNIASGTDAGLFLNHIKSLRDIILFLNQNQFKYNGMPLVLVNQTAFSPGAPAVTPEFDTLLSRQQQAQYTTYPPVEGGIRADRKSFQFFVNKEGLLNYLKDLLSKSQNVNNALFSKQINKLIADANKELGLAVVPQDTQTGEQAGQQPGVDQKNKPDMDAKYRYVSDKENEASEQNAQKVLEGVGFMFPFQIGENTFDVLQIEKFFFALERMIAPSGKPEEKNYMEALLSHKTQFIYEYLSRASGFISAYRALIGKQPALRTFLNGFTWDPSAAPAAQIATFKQMFSAIIEQQQLTSHDLSQIANLASSICAACIAPLNVLKYSPQISEALGGTGQMDAQIQYGTRMASSLRQLSNLLQSQAPRLL